MNEHFTLSSGQRIPLFGLGTYQVKNKSNIGELLPAALRLGYRLIDTAACYRNEAFIGEVLDDALAENGISRSEIFITSKLQPADQGYEAAWTAIRKSLNNLRLQYLDLYLIHWPGAAGLPPQSKENRQLRLGSWQALCEAYHQGLIRSIGVSNYTIRHLQEFDEVRDSPGFVFPMVNQIEIHLAWVPWDDIHWCENRNIFVQAYSSFGRGILLNSSFLEKFPIVATLAAKYGCSEQAVSPQTSDLSHDLTSLLLRWSMQHGWGVLPKTANSDRLKGNALVTLHPFQIDVSDMSILDAISSQLLADPKLCAECNLPCPPKVCWNPETVI